MGCLHLPHLQQNHFDCSELHDKFLTHFSHLEDEIGHLCKSQKAKISIVKDVSGIIKPSRLTLLLGPPGCGKTTLLLALAGKLNQSVKVAGEVFYNIYRLDEFVPQKPSAYISQYDLHKPEMTVRETTDFSARCQGVGSRAEIMKEVSKREKEAGIVPDIDIDTFMKATSIEGQKRTLQTDYILKVNYFQSEQGQCRL
ncbi:pleiotropic drug resistance protein 3-like [Camellia sinensis]|uniref:pleiotropic drug resistance protein 3-like n=1 Tax=Camellia sinensis TaxID=4442 RepID=UPI001035E53A|nr:pleiotropic drug resistance protein 3-like [Camellia sinensis]